MIYYRRFGTTYRPVFKKIPFGFQALEDGSDSKRKQEDFF